jgi:2-keto-4-pentenoate hydratase/2-oxohepta-3-ene-1,7-dioic acid hydratase in catechol pathway
VKIVRFDDDRIGVLKNEGELVDVSAMISHRVEKGSQRVIEEVIERFEALRPELERMAARERGVALSGVKLLAPIPRPSKCLAAFVNYLDRPDQKPENMPMEYFYKAPELVGPEGTVELLDIPPVTVFHAEAELAFVIGKRAKNVQKAAAMDHVFGYVPFFDISARGLVRRSQFVPKGQDTYGPCGPWITTKDEIPDPHNVVVKSWLNGKPKQNYNTKFMAHGIPDQIAWLTRFARLEPGDVIATGTYHEGLGPINNGDVLEIEIEKMGKARFFIKGHSPRKEAEWIPGVTQSTPPPGGRMHKV